MTAEAIDWFAPLERLGDRLSGELEPALLSVLVLVITFLIARMMSVRLRCGLERGGFQVNVAILLGRAGWFAAWVIGGIYVLHLFGVGPAPLATFIGVTGLAASLSLQSVLQNLVAGVYLLAEKPFAIGDLISVVGANGLNHEGTVLDIEMRTTHLRSRDNELILVPNAAIFNGVVTNRTAVGGHVTHLSVTFPRAANPSEVREAAIPLLQSVPSVLSSPGPELRVDTVAVDTWTASLSFWADTWEATSHAIWAFGHAFPDATINAPVAVA